MTGKKFLNVLANGKVDVIQEFSDLLAELKIDHCLIGDIGVNAYAEPVVSVDKEMDVLGYQLKVVASEDVLHGKIWAYLDEAKLKSKRQKDLADIMWLVETHKHLYDLLPQNIKEIF